MSIIYSYPEQGATVNPNDMLIGTSATKVGGKQKNLTKNFTIQQIADFINGGLGLIDPVATDFQIPVFNQGGLKITGSIMSQDSSPSNGVAGTGITVAGNLTATGNLLVSGSTTLGGAPGTTISLLGQTTFTGAVRDVNQSLGLNNQILLSNGNSQLVWQNYEAGLTYEGTWNAANNTTNGLANSPALVQGTGVSGHFYIVNVEGTTSLGPGLNDWHVGDWAIFLDEGGQPASWQKIDNTSTLTGSGTAGTLSKWTTPTTLNDSLVSETGTVVSVNGDLKVKDTIQATTTSSNLKLKGNGTGGVEIMSADGVTDGKITLNCSQNTHGVSIQSPAHAASQSYTLILPTQQGTLNQVLTSGNGTTSQLTWSTPSTGTVTNFTTVSTAIPGITTAVTNPTTTPELTLSITGTPGAALFLDGTGNWSSPGGGVTDIIATAPLNASAATGSVTLSMPAYATATGGYVPSGGATGEYLDGLSGNWTSLPVSGVTSVTGTANRIAITGTAAAPVVNAVTGTVNSSSLTLATGQEIQSAIDLALSGALTFKGTFNASTGEILSGVNINLYLYNCPGGAGTRVAVSVGDLYIASVAGSFYCSGANVNIGDEVIATVAALADASVIGGWSVVPSAGAGVTDVTFSSTINPSAGPALTITPTTGSVVVSANVFGGNGLHGIVSSGSSSNDNLYLKGDGSWASVPAGYTGWTVQQDSGTNITVSSGATLPIRGVVTTGGAGISTDNNASDVNIALINAGGTPSSSTFYRGDGQWAAPTGASATITTRSTTTANATTTVFALGATPNGGSTSFVDVFVDGVYQEISTYSVTGTTNITFGAAVPSGVTVETKTISDYSVGAAVQSVNGMTGAVLLSNPQYVAGNINPAVNGSLYIFDSTTTAYTITLPGSPSLGDSIKISNRGGLATNVLAANGNNIMGASTNLTINNVTSAFEIIWAAGSQGWVIIGNV
jgi:fibronectin-binding autotransporter adhesin